MTTTQLMISMVSIMVIYWPLYFQCEIYFRQYNLFFIFCFIARFFFLLFDSFDSLLAPCSMIRSLFTDSFRTLLQWISLDVTLSYWWFCHDVSLTLELQSLLREINFTPFARCNLSIDIEHVPICTISRWLLPNKYIL